MRADFFDRLEGLSDKIREPIDDFANQLTNMKASCSQELRETSP